MDALRVDLPVALAVYAESLATGARVAVFGDASLPLAERLLDIGASRVDVWDPDVERALVEAERAPEGVTVRALTDGHGVRDVDLALVPDLGTFEDREAVLGLVRRAVGDDGAAIVAAANRDAPSPAGEGLDYYELFDLVAAQFANVRMVAQLPFYGTVLAELGVEGESPAVSVDTQLAEGDRAPRSFVAVAGQRDVRLDPYSIVELPQPPASDEVAPLGDEARASYVPAAAPLADDVEELDEDEEDEEGVGDLRYALDQAHLHAEGLEREVGELRERLGEAVGEAAGAARTAAQLADALRVRSEELRVRTEELRGRSEELRVRSEDARLLSEESRARADESAILTAMVAERERRIADLSGQVLELRTAVEDGRVVAVELEKVARELRLGAEEGRLFAAAELERVTRELRLGAEEGRLFAAAELERVTRELQLGAEEGRLLAAAELERVTRELQLGAEEGRLAVEELEKVARRAAERDGRTEELARAAELHGEELLRMEEALRDRARSARVAETELGRRDQMVRELLDALEEARTEAGAAPDAARAAPVAEPEVRVVADPAVVEENGQLRQRLDALALEIARLQGEAQASAWSVAELERRARAAESAPPPERPTRQDDGRLSAALDEVDALRQALAQEHDARTKAESGEELARARAEIQRQAVLLEQMARELTSRDVGASGDLPHTIP